MTKPNFLILIVDELRYPTTYESKELKEWKEKNLKFMTKFAKKSTVFHNHYTNTTACTAARTTIQTGQYPLVHGVTQTDGIAKTSDDPAMTWLDKFTVPTIGNYFKESGYETILKGKWHISDSAIKFQNGQYMNTYDENGNPIPELEEIYLKQNPLKDYGYSGWIGPEPHGSSPLNSGSSVPETKQGRDIGFTKQITNQLEKLKHSKKPWLLAANLVNPHDIVLMGLLADNIVSPFDFEIDPTLPKKLFTKEYDISHNESLKTKPMAQTSYRDLYPKAVQPILNIDKYQRFYYSAQKYVDENLMKIYKKIKSMNMYKNTIILFLSDHGDLLASHGSMFQKWHNAYQESIHVPFMISSPLFRDKTNDIYDITSHIDILPTLLGFANINANEIRQKLMNNFGLALPLPGRDLSVYFKNKNNIISQLPLYFYTEDEPFKGNNQVNSIGQPYDAVQQPNHVQAIICNYKGKLWKLTNYYGSNPTKGEIIGELYNVNDDPIEVNNLINDCKYRDIQNYLVDQMNKYSFLYRGQ
ncbi:sulfatase [Catovirus CTV1]|uniref:Sulfatase n=1 Tax=Catovirus CTV1 TaxID=1977631 RepID=A0A1V0SA98_9VIRU|nr:sulfatase [Catovirus CTV1]